MEDSHEELNDSLFAMPEDIGSEDEGDIITENEEEATQKSSAFTNAVIWGTDWTTETINIQLFKNNIDLFPKFQRRDAWSNKDKSKFIESLILGLPIPQIILAEKNNAKGKYIVIDGKQRLLTIRRFFATDDNIKDSKEIFKPLRLSGLKILGKLNGKTFKDLKDNPEFTEELDQLENQSIRTIVLKNWRDESFLYTVFLRLNTGSKQLSTQELRQALHPGAFIDYADEFSANSESMKTMLNLKTPDSRMRDVELTVRYFANKYFLADYNGKLKDFFDRTVAILNTEWEQKSEEIKNFANELNNAIDFSIELFGDKKFAFSKWTNEGFQGNFNRAIYDIMVYYFSNPSLRNEAEKKRPEILQSFKTLCLNDTAFLNSFEHTTKSTQSTFKRLTTWGESLAEILEIEIEVPYHENGVFSIRKR